MSQWRKPGAEGAMPSFLCFFLCCSPKFTTSKSSQRSQWTKHSGYFLMTHLWPPEPLNGHYQTLLDQDKKPESHNNINSAPESGVRGSSESYSVLPAHLTQLWPSHWTHSKSELGLSYFRSFSINRFPRTNKTVLRISVHGADDNKGAKGRVFPYSQYCDTKCVGFFPSLQPRSPTLDTSRCPTIKFNSLRICLELAQTPQFKNSVSKDCPRFRYQSLA